MTFKKIALAAVAFGAIGMAAPASAWGWGGSSTSGWHGSSSGGHGSSSGWHGSSSGGHSSSSGGHGSSSGGTKVPEPGMLGIFGAGVLAVGVSRMRRRRKG